MKTSIVILLSFVSTAAMADYSLSGSGKAVTCYGEDNQSFVLAKTRRTVKYTVEGESRGAKAVIKSSSDRETFRSYTTKEGTLTLSDKGDTFQFSGDDSAFTVNCQ